MKYCHKCLGPWDGLTQPGARERCGTCGEDLHVCMNCKLYDPRKSQQCAIETDPVRDKERANYCEEFQFADRPLPSKDQQKQSGTSEAEKARERFKKLFGK